MEINYRNTKYSVKFGSGQGLTKGVAILGALMIIGFLLTQTNKSLFYSVFGFVPSLAIGRLRIWQFITAMFLHINMSHLFFNLFGLYVFGCAAEPILKTREFVKYFLLCGLGGFAFTYLLWLTGLTPNNLSIGASGAIYGVLLAFSLLFPNQKILAYFVIPMRAKWLALSFAILEVFLSLRSDGISHIGHLGGLATGLGYFAYTRGPSFIKEALNA
jgi:membrane associated rhomboid family serine protease